MRKPKTIVITGAESTGKSTITEALALHYAAPYVPEIAREYVENLNRHYSYRDVEQIAKMQVLHFQKLLNSKHPIIFIDTWLINTKVWFEVAFNKVPSWIENEILKSKIDLFLVCDNDLPWISDPVRENGGENREILKTEYIRNIENYNLGWKLVSGKNEVRTKNAINFIDNL